MAITPGSVLEISMRGALFGQQTINVYDYVIGSVSPTVEMVHVAEAWWNAVKTTLRPLVGQAHASAFNSVLIREISVAGGMYAEYAVPPDERVGTGASAAGENPPPFVAAGIRLTVGSGLTRPGQKRIGGAGDSDTNSSTWEVAYITKLNAFAAVISNTLVLGAPALTAVLDPVVCRKPGGGAAVTVFQPVVGYVVNGYITTQNSRKIGRGV